MLWTVRNKSFTIPQAMAHQFYFSPHILDNLVPPRAGFEVVQDAAEPQLRMYITARGVKTFFTRKRVRGVDTRILIGRYPDISIDSARAKIAPVLNLAQRPVVIRRKKITFGDLAAQFTTKKIRRAQPARDKLIRTMAEKLSEIYPVHIDAIKMSQVSKIIEKIARKSGAPTANRMREAISGVFKFACQLGYATENPVTEIPPVLEMRRIRTLSEAGLRRLIAAIESEKNQSVRAAFLMLVYGFANKRKVFSMRWSDLDFNSYTWGNMPLSDAAAVVLRDLPQVKQFVFPGRGGRGHLTDPRAAWSRVVTAARLRDVQMDDVHKFMLRRLEWAGDRETMRANMNKAIEELMGGV